MGDTTINSEFSNYFKSKLIYRFPKPGWFARIELESNYYEHNKAHVQVADQYFIFIKSCSTSYYINSYYFCNIQFWSFNNNKILYTSINKNDLIKFRGPF